MRLVPLLSQGGSRFAIAMACLGSLVLASTSVPGDAQSGQGSFSPTGRVHGNCSITSTTQPATIAYDPIQANFTSPATGSGSLNIQCTPRAIATIDMDHGSNASPQGSYYSPNMLGGTSGALLQYFIYSDSAHTSLWGTTTSANGGTTAGSLVTINGTGSTVDYTFYISVPADQNIPADSYTDTVTATVTY